MNKQRQNTKYGFTIIEVLVVITILALIAGIGGGFCVGTYKRMLVEKAARDFFLAAKYARIMAIEQQRQYRLQLDTTNGGFYLLYNALNAETGQTQQTIVRDVYSKPVEFAGDVKFEDVQITPLETESSDPETAIVFSPNGTAQTAVIQIGDGENHYTASVCAATGKAVIYPGTTKEAEAGTIDLDKE